MALNGFVSAEDRATRLVKTRFGFVVCIRRSPQHYEVRRDGATLGHVTKFKHWFAERTGNKAFMGPMGSGSRWPQKTRQAAIEWLVKYESSRVFDATLNTGAAGIQEKAT